MINTELQFNELKNFEETLDNFSFSFSIEQCLEKMQESVRCILIVSGTMGLIHMP